jgi:hypothetical protein
MNEPIELIIEPESRNDYIGRFRKTSTAYPKQEYQLYVEWNPEVNVEQLVELRSDI